MQDPVTIKRFLAALYGEIPATALLGISTKPRGSSALATKLHSHIDGAVEHAARDAAKADVYVNVGLRRADLERGRGKKGDVVAMPGLYLDIDISTGVHKRGGLPPDEDAAMSVLAAMPVEPTIVVHSGGGLQAYYLFEALHWFTRDTDWPAFEALSRGWEAAARTAAEAYGWTLDAVWDSTRVLRVAGTLNHKSAPPKQVQVLVWDGPRLAGLDAVRSHVRPIDAPPSRMAPTSSRNGSHPAATSNSTHGWFTGTIDLDASPPLERFMALQENNRKFRLSVERKRPDLKDQSSSGYDESLANFGVLAGWSDQEIVNLLIYTARKHGDDLTKRMRPDYLGRTIALARKGREEHAAAMELAAMAASRESAGDVDRARVLQLLTRMLGGVVQVRGWLQLGDEDAQYSLETSEGEIAIGTVSTVLNPDRFRERLYQATAGRATLPPFKKADWLDVAKALGQIVEHISIPEMTRDGQVLDWVRGYLAGAPPAEGVEARLEALPLGLPFTLEGDLYVNAPALLKHIQHSQPEKLTAAKVYAMLRPFGFQPESVTIWIPDTGPANRRYWRVPLTLVHPQDAADAVGQPDLSAV